MVETALSNKTALGRSGGNQVLSTQGGSSGAGFPELVINSFCRVLGGFFYLLPVFLCLVLSACSVLSLRGNEETAIQEPEKETAPVDVRILEETVVNNLLELKVELRALAYLDAQDVMIEAVGLAEGDVLQRESKHLGDLINQKMLEPDQAVIISFSIPAENLAEYQVRCIWGQPEKAVSSPEEQLVLRNLVVFSEIVDCLPESRTGQENDERSGRNDHGGAGSDLSGSQGGNCKIRYTLEGVLANYSQQTVRGIVLALGTNWIRQGQEASVPNAFEPLRASEERIFLNRFELGPGEQKKLKIRLKKSFPVIAGGSFIPHLRLLTQGTENVSKSEKN